MGGWSVECGQYFVSTVSNLVCHTEQRTNTLPGKPKVAVSLNSFFFVNVMIARPFHICAKEARAPLARVCVLFCPSYVMTSLVSGSLPYGILVAFMSRTCLRPSRPPQLATFVTPNSLFIVEGARHRSKSGGDPGGRRGRGQGHQHVPAHRKVFGTPGTRQNRP